MANIRHPKDFASGVMFTAFGIAALVIGADYRLGTAARMGPGYFPRILGILLILFGIVLMLRALRLSGGKIEFGSPIPVAIVLAGVVLFGIIVPYAGLVVSAILLIVICSAASSQFRWKEALLSGVILTTLSVFGFVWALGLMFPVWPTFITGY